MGRFRHIYPQKQREYLGLSSGTKYSHQYQQKRTETNKDSSINWRFRPLRRNRRIIPANPAFIQTHQQIRDHRQMHHPTLARGNQLRRNRSHYRNYVKQRWRSPQSHKRKTNQ